jgi:hypothetical protein
MTEKYIIENFTAGIGVDEYISRFALMNERKRDIENFFEEKLTLA